MAFFRNKKNLVKQIENQTVKNLNTQLLHHYGKHIVESVQKMLEATIGSKTKLTESIKYEIKDGLLVIYSDNEIATFIEKGTKPHIIRPKNKKALAFRSLQGHPSQAVSEYGNKVIVKEVRHPGTEARPFFNIGIMQGIKKAQDALK